MNTIHKCLFVFVLLAGFNCATAQKTLKFGYINTQELVSAMPESDSAQKKLDAFTKELGSTLESMQVEYNRINKGIEGEFEKLPELIIKTKESELNDLKVRIQTYTQSAQEEIQNKQSELIGAVYAKARKAIEAVGKEGGFSAVYEAGALIYISPDFTNLMPLVKAKLGIKNTPTPSSPVQH